MEGFQNTNLSIGVRIFYRILGTKTSPKDSKSFVIIWLEKTFLISFRLSLRILNRALQGRAVRLNIIF